MKRVVVTGMSGVTALGSQWGQVEQGLRGLTNRVQVLPEWARYSGLNTRLGAPIEGFEVPAHYPRKKLRSMGRVSRLATVATEAALADAGLLDHPVLTGGRTGVAYGSSTGSTEPFKAFGTMLNEYSTRGVTANSYIQMMSHTAAVNLALFFGATGRVITTSSACTSGSQGIGYAWEAIRHGYQTVMIAGGAEELCPTEVAVFDTLYATSVRNEEPEATPRPFDAARDGLVIGEGAGTLILEELEHAQARGATIHAELVGFGTNNDAQHVTQPTDATMRVAMELALESAALGGDAIGYVCAHGTATERGDIAESQATAALFGNRVPVSSLKSYLGHTLGACGALESWMGIEMMKRGWFAPTINLERVDPACAELDYVQGAGRDIQCEYFMNNNFAFGGINTSLIFKRWG
ncbi:beta-ketoacyl-ACP synthase [Aestuariirhabdus litorea]|uniref:Beta-ketoacyl-ACP synthase n=1 Tax=Aestuariirhabdus litorea TaxID=2528527 RepID=A0A3P3VK81_9GAMM|nr:beta-ketoacyl-ACP synthase [Aestuariirhabdus litorea]RWW92943.1 beta-ketoacyl-ACP synthase [Endozoicomonadaceae bacterium GTF-13]